MADRSVVVRLVADTKGYITSVGAAAAATKEFGVSAALAAEKHAKAWQDIALPVGLAGAALAGLAVASVIAASEFDKQMSVVKANIDDKSAPAMKRLEEAALSAGRTTAYSATDAARAEEELAKAGLHAAEITGGALSAALSLASAGQLDLGTAAEITASTMTQFNLKAADAGHIADVLAAGADKSLGGVTDLAEGLKYSGVAASQFGMSVEQTVGLLANFASAGIMGSMAGTGLREMLVRLASPTAAASAEIHALGLNFYDSTGKFLGMANVAEQLKTKLSGLSDQQRQQTLVTLFGQRAMAEANLLYQQGAAGVDKWTGAVNDQGFAALQASTKLDNLNGDLTKLKNSLNAAMIEAGQGAQGPLRSLTQGVTNAVNAFAGLPPELQSTILGLAGASGAALLGVAGFVTLSVKIGETVKAFKELQIASKLAMFASPLGVALGVATVALGAFVKSQMDAAAASQELRQTLDQTTGAITDQTTALVAQRIQQALSQQVTDQASGTVTTLAQAYSGLGLSLADMTRYALGSSDAVDKVNAAQAANSAILDTLTAKHGNLTTAEYDQLVAAQSQADMWARLKAILGDTSAGLGDQVASQQKLGEAVKEVSSSNDAASSAAKANAEAMAAQEQAAKDAAKANVDLLKSLSALADLALGARGAQREFASAVDAASKAVKDNGATLDINTKKGRDNQAALDGIAAAALKNVEATFKNRDATQDLSVAVGVAEQQVNAGRDAFIQHAVQMGMDRGAAAKLADQLGLTVQNVDRLSQTLDAVPKTTTAVVTADATPANAAVDGARRKLAAMDGYTVTSTIMVTARFDAAAAAAMTLGSARKLAVVPGFSVGGYTGDTGGVVHPREYVLNEAATARLGLPYLNALNSGQMSRLAPPPAPVAAPMATVTPVEQHNNYYGITDPERLSARVRSDLAWALRAS